MKLAIYQGAGVPAQPEANLLLLEDAAGKAANHGADLLILPELFLSGYDVGKAIQQLAEPSNGPCLARVSRIAREYCLSVLVGYPERYCDRVYNSAILFGPDGGQLANYRKRQLFGDAERRLFVPGDEFVICTVAGWRVGILICFDVEFPEPVRVLAAQGAELVVVPTACCATNAPEILVPARALENQIYVAYANRSGSEGNLTYCGRSCVAGPDGEVLVRAAEGETLLVCEISREAIVREREHFSYLAERRTF